MDDRSTMSDVSEDELSSVTSVSSLDSSFDTFNSSWSESVCTSMDEQFHVDDSGVDDRDPLQQPLYDGADISVSDSHALLLLYFLRHGLRKKAQSELLQLIELHLPQSAKTAGSLYKLKKLLREFLSMCKLTLTASVMDAMALYNLGKAAKTVVVRVPR